MQSVSLEELKLHLETAEKAENNHLTFICNLESVPLSLSAQLKYTDTGDCGKGYKYLYSVSLYNNSNLIMDTDPLNNADETFRMFATFAHGSGNAWFFFDGER